MAMLEANDAGVQGDFLPEDSRLRLKKLRDHVAFLSRLAQSRTSGDERAPGVRVDGFAACLELLAEQVDLVLEEMSRAAPPQVDADAAGRDHAPVTGTSKARDERFTFGITLDQVDALDRLIQTISAHGDVVAAGHAAELAGQTLPLIGQAICDGAAAVRSILDEVEAQRLGRAPRPRTGVGETRGIYAAGLVFPVEDDASGTRLLPLVGGDRLRPVRRPGLFGPGSPSLPDGRRRFRRSSRMTPRGPADEIARGAMRRAGAGR